MANVSFAPIAGLGVNVEVHSIMGNGFTVVVSGPGIKNAVHNVYDFKGMYVWDYDNIARRVARGIEWMLDGVETEADVRKVLSGVEWSDFLEARVS